jgi:hypothetical protein
MASITPYHSQYAAQLYDPRTLRETMERATEAARKIRTTIPFDAIAFRGSSGAALAYPISAALEVPAVYVRKPTEISHGRSIEGPSTEVSRYLIVDDMISSGATVCAVRAALHPAECVAILLYADTWGAPDNLAPVFNLHGDMVRDGDPVVRDGTGYRPEPEVYVPAPRSSGIPLPAEVPVQTSTGSSQMETYTNGWGVSNAKLRAMLDACPLAPAKRWVGFYEVSDFNASLKLSPREIKAFTPSKPRKPMPAYRQLKSSGTYKAG